jgi:predicted AlkP superfamily pyrophosphatase or phosphodiesterase
MKRFTCAARIAGIVLALALFSACTTAPTPVGPAPVVLISLDAFRWDYCAKYPAETPNLRQLIAEGSSARQLTPVFPANTFPNHYTLVTGLYPAHHGIINNEMFDPTTGRYFRHLQPQSVHESEWWSGEPLWITAIKQGYPAATSFWIGAETKIQGMYPSFWKYYDSKQPFQERLDELSSWFKLPPGQRPVFVAFYLEETNSIGHKFGPDSPEIAAAIRQNDDRVGQILTRLKAEGVVPNVVVVSDHGMTAISADRYLLLDDYLDLSSVQIDFFGPVAGLRPLEGTPESIVRALSAFPHARVCLAKDLPARFHMTGNVRIPPVWILPDEGWEVDTRAHFSRIRPYLNHGDHGFDPKLDSMGGILIAAGPAFKNGVVIDPVENVHVYNLICATLGLKPAPNDGDDRLVKAFLRK